MKIAIVVLVILLVLTIFKMLIYKMSMLAVIEFYLEERGGEIPDREALQKHQMRVLKKWLHIKSPSNLPKNV